MNKKKIIFTIFLVIFATIWIAGIYKLSGMNANNSDKASKGVISIFIEDSIYATNKYGITNIDASISKIDKISTILNMPLRKVMHAFVYFVLASIILFTINYYQDNKRYIFSIIITLALIIIAASFDEFHQTFVDGRSGSIKDVIIDTTGAMVSMAIFTTYYLTYKKGYDSGIKKTNVLKYGKGDLNEAKN